MELPALSCNSHVQHEKSKFAVDASCKKVRSESAALTEVLRGVVRVIRNTLEHDDARSGTRGAAMNHMPVGRCLTHSPTAVATRAGPHALRGKREERPATDSPLSKGFGHQLGETRFSRRVGK
jgi:hypothetical protein